MHSFLTVIMSIYECVTLKSPNFPESVLSSLFWSYRSMLKMHFYLHEHFPEKACTYIPFNLTLLSIGLKKKKKKMFFKSQDWNLKLQTSTTC